MKFLAVIKPDFAAKMCCDEVVFLPAPKDGSPRRFIAYKVDGTCVMCAFIPYAENASKSTEPKSKYDNIREVMPWLADKTDDEIAAEIERMKQAQAK